MDARLRADTSPWANRLATAAFACLLVLDVAVRFCAAHGHENYSAGDALAPLALVDQILHGALPDAGRQQLGAALVTAFAIKLAGAGLSATSLLHAAGSVTALASSLTLLPLYALGRMSLGAVWALVPVVLLMSNPSYLVHSSYYNPTQFLALIFTLMLWCAARVQRSGCGASYLLLCLLAGAAYLVRHEGLVFIAAAIMASLLFWQSGIISGRRLLCGGSVAGGGLALGWAAHFFFTTQPFAYVHNTNATGGWFSAARASPAQLVQIVVRAMQWKMEKLTAFAILLTMPGCVLATVGGWLQRHSGAFVFAALYFVLYETLLFVYTILLPIGTEAHLVVPEMLNPLPCPRYYQIYLPFACLLVTFALRRCARAQRLVRYALPVFLVGVVGYQATVGVFTYQATLQQPGQQREVARNLEIASFFREHGIRQAGILCCAPEGGTLKVYRKDPFWTHPIHLSVLSGNNDVNCWGFDLTRPNVTCVDRYGTDYVSQILRWSGAPIQFLVVLAHLDQATISEFGTEVLHGRDFCIIQCRPEAP